MEMYTTSDWTAMRSRFVAPIFLAAKGGVRPQTADAATFLGPRSWSPPIT